MSAPPLFHDLRLQDVLPLEAGEILEYSTELVTTASGFEHCNARWAQPRRRYDVHIGNRSLRDLRQLAKFFRARRGRLHGFLWRDRIDYRSVNRGAGPWATDQPMQMLSADGRVWAFYKGLQHGLADRRARRIFKPIAASVGLAHAGQPIPKSHYTVHAAQGVIAFASAHRRRAQVTAGFEFDVPVRFDTDRLDIQLTSPNAGSCAPIPLVEIRLPEISPQDIA